MTKRKIIFATYSELPELYDDDKRAMAAVQNLGLDALPAVCAADRFAIVLKNMVSR